MLNIQIRGAKIKIAVGSINQKQVKGLFNQISEKKCSLADIMLSSQWELHNDIFSCATPIITSGAELIITSYDSNDYYNEGHSFFISRVTDVIQDIPVQKLIDYKNQSYLQPSANRMVQGRFSSKPNKKRGIEPLCKSIFLYLLKF